MPVDLAIVDECTARLVEYATGDPIMRRALAEAESVFFANRAKPRVSPDAEMAQARLLDWFVFDHRVGGGATPLEAYLHIHGARLAEDERNVVRDLRYSVYSVFEVVDVQHGEAVLLRDLADDTEYPVVERSASTVLRRGAYVLGRVLPFDDSHVLSAVLSVWGRDATHSIRSEFERARSNAGSIFVSPLDMEGLFGRSPQLPRPAPELADTDEIAEPVLPPEPQLEDDERPARDGVPSIEELTTYASLSTSPFEVLDIVQQYHDIRTPEELRTVLDSIHRVLDESAESRADEPFMLRVEVPLAAGPRERVLMRMFAATAQHEITQERYPEPATARSAFRELQRRWLDTRQERLDSVTPREIIEAERTRMGRDTAGLP